MYNLTDIGTIKEIITKDNIDEFDIMNLEFENGALGIIEGSTTCYPGYPRRIVISGSGDDFCYPCGACRQFLYEFKL